MSESVEHDSSRFATGGDTPLSKAPELSELAQARARASLVEETDRFLESLELLDHQRPIAALARTLAASIEDEPTAAACDQYRRTVAELTSARAKQSKSSGITGRIRGDESS